MRHLFGLRDLCGANIFATSRDIPDIASVFIQSSVVLEIVARESDVRKYIQCQMDRLRGFIRGTPLQDEICTEIVKSMGGMYVASSPFHAAMTYSHDARFLLARLHFDTIVGAMTVRELRRALALLPTGSSAYDDATKTQWKEYGDSPKAKKTWP